jgi:serine-type D-Ala-D-Ala carboxypeptidase (penicillin-binding protein 5/6)
MRIAGGFAAGALVAGMILAVSVTGPAARAAVGTAPAAAKAAAPAGVQSRWAELANAVTGADLWSRSSVQERPMGSITKVMTAYVVLSTPGLNLERSVTVPEGIVAYDEEYDASTAGLIPGERYTVLQLLYALLLPSGCDAAYTLADAFGPGLPGFIAKMNATARQLGLTKTHFADVSGLPDPTSYATYSTAHDLIALGRDAMSNRTFAAIAGTREYRLPGGSAHQAHTWVNLNPLLGTFPGAVGIKTGYTAAAGQCLLFEAKRGGTTLIGEVLDSSPVDASSLAAAASDAAAMLDWGFTDS